MSSAPESVLPSVSFGLISAPSPDSCIQPKAIETNYVLYLTIGQETGH